jgi:tetratricopeptide (TPR) repeat protein
MKQLIALLFAVVSLAGAQSEIDELILEGRKQIEEGWASFDKQIMMDARSKFERAVNADPQNKYAIYYLAYAEYRLLTQSFSKEDDETFDQMIDGAVEHCEKAIELGNGWSELKAILSALYGYKIGKNWMSAITLGPKSNSLMEEALEKEPENPRVLLIRGTSYFNKPSMFGGSVDKAQGDFENSIRSYESQKDSTLLNPSWGYTDALTWLGKAYEAKEMNDKAMEVYKKVLKVNPDFGWVKYSE